VNIIVNDQPKDVEPSTTVAELLAQLGLADKYVAVEVNRDLVPKQKHAERHLADGDQVEIVTLVGGG